MGGAVADPEVGLGLDDHDTADLGARPPDEEASEERLRHPRGFAEVEGARKGPPGGPLQDRL